MFTSDSTRVQGLFVHALEVHSTDIDMLGHVSNVAYVKWVQDAAVAHSEAVGFGIAQYNQLGAVFVVRRHEIEYLRPAMHGDRVEVRTWVESAAAAKCVRATEVVRVNSAQQGAQPQPEVMLARAKTTWGYMELATGRPRRIPDPIRAAFSQPLMKARAAAQALAGVDGVDATDASDAAPSGQSRCDSSETALA